MATLPESIGIAVPLKKVEKSTRTFLIDWSTKQIAGMDEGLEAMRQAVEILLNTERFRWQIYSSDFGVELEDLIGEEYDYVVSDMPRRIEEALSVDSRILSVDDFAFEQKEDRISCSFRVNTVYGALKEEVSV